MKFPIWLFFLVFPAFPLIAQDSIPSRLSFFEHAPEYNRQRVRIIAGTGVVAYAGTMYVLNEQWYADYPRSSFQLFNDNREWLQIDKGGHALTAYYLGYLGIDIMKWAGVDDKKAAWYGGSLGSVFLTTIEILDGFSAEWGFSIGDMAANTFGSLMATTQHLAWQEQKIRLKLSFSFPEYQDGAHERAEHLFGKSPGEKLLKDYNGHTFWLSFNLKSLAGPENKLPGWLNLSVGYGAEGLLGGFDNIARDKEGNVIADFSHIPRYRQYFISPDVDFSRLKGNSRFLNTILDMANAIKFPAPAVEYNRIDGLNFYLLYF